MFIESLDIRTLPWKSIPGKKRAVFGGLEVLDAHLLLPRRIRWTEHIWSRRPELYWRYWRRWGRHLWQSHKHDRRSLLGGPIEDCILRSCTTQAGRRCRCVDVANHGVAESIQGNVREASNKLVSTSPRLVFPHSNVSRTSTTII